MSKPKSGVFNAPVVALIVVASAAVLLPHSRPAAAESPAMPQDRQLVKVVNQLTDVVVTGRDGNFVPGLGLGDFQLEIDGRRREIMAVDQAQGGRNIVLVFDRFNLGDSSLADAKRLAQRIIEEALRPEDRVAILQYNGLLQTLSGWTKDRERQLAAINKAGGTSLNRQYHPTKLDLDIPLTLTKDGKPKRYGSIPEDLERSIVEDGEYRIAEILERGVYLANFHVSMQNLAKALGEVPGRKSIVFFSEGPNIYMTDFINKAVEKKYPRDKRLLRRYAREDIRGFSRLGRTFSRSENDIRLTVRALSTRGIAVHLKELSSEYDAAVSSIHVIRPGGAIPEWQRVVMEGAGSDSTFVIRGAASLREKQVYMAGIKSDYLRDLAASNSGRYFDYPTSPEEIIGALEEEVGHFYTLAFSPMEDSKSQYHKIRIRTTNPAFKVIHRRSFYSRPPFASLSEEDREQQLTEGLFAPGIHDDLGLEARAFCIPTPTGRTSLLAFQFDASSLGSARGAMEIELLAQAVDTGGRICRRERKKLASPQRDSLGPELWGSFEMPLPEEWCAIYLVVRDNATGRRSTWNQVFEPQGSIEDVLLSDPILVAAPGAGALSAWQVRESISSPEGGEQDTGSPTALGLSMPGRPYLEHRIPQGEEPTLVVLASRLPATFNPAESSVGVQYVLTHGEDEAYALSAPDQKIQFLPGPRMLLVSARLPLGSAPEERGKLAVVLGGLTENVITTDCAFSIPDFDPDRINPLVANELFTPLESNAAEEPVAETNDTAVKTEEPLSASASANFANAQMVLVEVLDNEGNPVVGLEPHDFAVKCDGAATEMLSVEEIGALDDSLEEGAETAAENAQPRVARGSGLVAILFDRSGLMEDGLAPARASARQIILSALKPGDWAAVYIISADGTTRTVAAPTKDHETVVEAIDTVPDIIDLPTQSDSTYHRAASLKRYTDSISQAAHALELIPGRKYLLLFSDGPHIVKDNKKLFPLDQRGKDYEFKSDPSLLRILGPLARELAGLQTALTVVSMGKIILEPAVAQTSDSPDGGIMLIDSSDWSKSAKRDGARRIEEEKEPLYVSPTAHAEGDAAQAIKQRSDIRRDFLDDLAKLNGGAFYSRELNDSRLVEQLRQDLGHYYILEFSNPSLRPGRFYNLKIETEIGDSQVRYHRLLATARPFPALSPAERSIHLERGLNDPTPANDLGLNIVGTLLPLRDRPTALLNLEFGSEVLGQKADGGNELEMLIRVEDDEGRPRFREHKIFRSGGDLPPTLWLSLPLPVTAGPCVAGLVLRDNTTGLRSAWRESFDLEAQLTGAVSLSRPLLLDDTTGGCLADWAMEQVTESIEVQDPLLPADFVLTAKPILGGVPVQGQCVRLLLFLGVPRVDLLDDPVAARAEFFLDPESSEPFRLKASEVELEPLGDSGGFLFSALLPLGLAQQPSGELGVIIKGVVRGEEIKTKLPYSIESFSPEKAKELLRDPRLKPVK